MKRKKIPRPPTDFAVLARYSRKEQAAYLIDPMFDGNPVSRVRSHVIGQRNAAVLLMHTLEGQTITAWFKINPDGSITETVEPAKLWRDLHDPI